MKSICKNIEEYMMKDTFDNMIADILNNKKLNPILTELFIRGRVRNISLVFITQS